MEPLIRAYQKADKNECLDAFRSNVPQYFTHDEISDFKHFLIRLESGNESAYFYVVVSNQHIIGCGGFGDKDNNGIVSLAWGFIHKNYHKQGFGEKLLLYRLEKIKQLKPSAPVVIDTTQHSEGFFSNYGFKTKKVTENFYAPGMHRYDMELVLHERKI